MQREVKSLTPRHFRIVDLTVRGWEPQRIAEELDMSRAMVTIIVNSPTFKHELAIRRAIYEERADDAAATSDDEVTKALKDGAIKAARKLVGHVDSIDDAISVKSCEAVLDRSGYGKKREESVAAAGPTIIINAEDSARLVKAIEVVK